MCVKVIDSRETKIRHLEQKERRLFENQRTTISKILSVSMIQEVEKFAKNWLDQRNLPLSLTSNNIRRGRWGFYCIFFCTFMLFLGSHVKSWWWRGRERLWVWCVSTSDTWRKRRRIMTSAETRSDGERSVCDVSLQLLYFTSSEMSYFVSMDVYFFVFETELRDNSRDREQIRRWFFNGNYKPRQDCTKDWCIWKKKRRIEWSKWMI